MDLEPLLVLETGTAVEVAEAVALMVLAGSYRTEAAINRVLTARPEAEVQGLLRVLAVAPPRDAGWARLAAARLRDGNREVRRAAAQVVQLQGNWRQSVEICAAVSVEKDPLVLPGLWNAAIDIARGPEDLPPLPDDPVLRFDILSNMAEEPRRPRMVQAAWLSWSARRPAGIPVGFGHDAPRLVRNAGAKALAESFETDDWSGDLSPSALEELANSPRSNARLVALNRACGEAEGFARAAALLDDPENEIREMAEERLTDYLEAWWDEEPRDRIEHFRRLARAARIAVDSPLGLCTPVEVAWAAREIVAAGRTSSAMATLAVEMLASMGPDGHDALLELESDPDLGAAAANARRVIDLGLRGGIEFDEGLDSRPWLDWYAYRVPWHKWKRLSASPDPGDRWYASALLPGAWDDMDHRPELLERARPLIDDDDSEVAESAREFARWRAPELLPVEDELRPGEAWTRPRGYALTRLRRTADSLAPLNADAARSIFQRGDRALVLKVAHANRFVSDDVRDSIYNTGEPALLWMLIRQFENLQVASWPAWCAHVAASGPPGCRLLSAAARNADMPIRGYAIASLLASRWGSEGAAEAIVDLAAQEGDPAEAALVYAVQNGGLAWRAPLPRAVADALVRATLRRLEAGALEKARILVQNFGSQSLRNATPALLASLASDPSLADAAVAARAWIGDLPDIHDRLMNGPTWLRSTALELLPGNRVTLVRSLLRAWQLAGHHREQIEPFRIRVSWLQLSIAILDEAAWDEQGREALLDLRAAIGRYVDPTSADEVPASMRTASGPMQDEFAGASWVDRLSASRTFQTEPTAEGFSLLAAAAFRGASGDEIATEALTSRLGPDSLPNLIPLLGRPDPLVRAAAATAISRAAGPAKRLAVAALHASEGAEPSEDTRLRMLAALARLEDAGAIARLGESAASADPDRRLAALRALRYAPTRASALLLAPLTDDEDAVVREEAVAALASMTRRENRMGDPPFARAAKWIEWLDANPGARLYDPAIAQQDYYDYYDW